MASTQELGNVEAYYWVLSTKLQWNYFDHPPMVAWLIRLTTLNLLIHSELAVRFGAIISSAVCTWLMFKIGTLLHNNRAGWMAALLYTTSIYSGSGIAAFILPDSVQMVFWLASFYTMLQLIRLPFDDPKNNFKWLLFGILSGLCIMSKVHGVFLGAGLLSYLLIYDRKRLNNKYVYLALAISLIIVSPIFIWNVQNHFITYKFHSNRVIPTGTGIDFTRFIKQLFEVIFSTGPIHLFLIGTATYSVIKNRLQLNKSDVRLILLVTLPLIFLVLIISLFRSILPHWPGPGLSTLLVLPAVQLATNQKNEKARVPVILKFAISYMLLVAVLDAVNINYFPGTSSQEKDAMKFGADDASLDMYGWKNAGFKFDSLYRSDVATRLMPANTPIVISDWVSGAHIDYYIARGAGLQTYALGNVYALHQYYWINRDKKPLVKGDNAYFIIPSNLFTYSAFDAVKAGFNNYNNALTLAEYRSGAICKEFYVIRLYDYKGPLK